MEYSWRVRVVLVLAVLSSSAAPASTNTVTEAEAIRIFLERSPQARRVQVIERTVDAESRVETRVANPDVAYQVEDAAGVARLLGIVAQVGNDVVARLALDLGDPIEVELRRRGAQVRQLVVGDRQAELGLRFGERDPQLAPQAVAVLGGEKLGHLGRGVALMEGILRSRGCGGCVGRSVGHGEF